MAQLIPNDPDWLSQVQEEIIDPERPIVDPHHHLWSRPYSYYLLEEFWKDTGSGHNIEKTVFIECRTHYREEGPEHLRPVGETEFAIEIAEQSDQGDANQAKIAGIVAHANLTLGDVVEEVLQAHEEAGRGRFRGIRHSGARDENKEALSIPGRGSEGLYEQSDFRQGVKVLGQKGLTFDTWLYHHQIPDFTELARAVPETTMIIDHFGTPLGVGPYANQKDAIFEQWKKDFAELAQCENVVAKLGGMAMPDNGYGWYGSDKPPTSDEFANAQKRYYLHAIECFGPNRCMFESNFPVDKFSISYPVLWNGFKKMVSDFSESEKDALFRSTATRIYRL